jgi:hypothetical protein
LLVEKDLGKMGTGPIFCRYVLKLRMSSFLQNGACPHLLFFAFIHTNAIFTNALYCLRSCFFYKWEEERSRIFYEDRKYLYRFNPGNDILKRLYEVFEKSKKQDLIPKRRG